MIRTMPIPANPAYERAFTLVEMAMVMVIIALLMAGLLPMITLQMEQQKLSETKRQLNEIQQAIIGFAIIKGRLPCPAPANNHGIEKYSGTVGASDCTNFFDGFLPGATLGLTSLNEDGLVLDAWDRPIRYAVTEWDSTGTSHYVNDNGLATVGLSALSPNLQVCATATGLTGSGCASGQALTADPGVPALLFSTGKNWATGGTGTDEAENLDNDRFFISHTTSAGGTNGEFDDLVVWISNQTLISRMVAAGKLP